MTTKALSRKLMKEIANIGHRTAYAMGGLFLDKHDFKQGRVQGTNGFFIKHGYREINNDSMVPISELVIGAKLKNRHALPQVGARSITRLVRQSFVGNQVWLADDVQLSVKRFIEPFTMFLSQYEEHLDVFAGIYENLYTHTNVLGIYVMLKDVEDDEHRFAWEITIDDADLVAAVAFETTFHS
jgi:hypothetical protein